MTLKHLGIDDSNREPDTNMAMPSPPNFTPLADRKRFRNDVKEIKFVYKQCNESNDCFMACMALHDDDTVSTYADYDFIEKWHIKLETHMPKDKL